MLENETKHWNQVCENAWIINDLTWTKTGINDRFIVRAGSYKIPEEEKGEILAVRHSIFGPVKVIEVGILDSYDKKIISYTLFTTFFLTDPIGRLDDFEGSRTKIEEVLADAKTSTVHTRISINKRTEKAVKLFQMQKYLKMAKNKKLRRTKDSNGKDVLANFLPQSQLPID